LNENEGIGSILASIGASPISLRGGGFGGSIASELWEGGPETKLFDQIPLCENPEYDENQSRQG